MKREKRLQIVEEIIYLLKREGSAEEAVRILGILSSFYLHQLPRRSRRDDFETWVHNLYEAEFELERFFSD